MSHTFCRAVPSPLCCSTPVFFFLAALSLVWNKFQNDNNNNKKEQTCLPFCAGPWRSLVHKLRFACRGSFYAFHSSLSLSSPIKPEMSARTTINFQNNTSHAWANIKCDGQCLAGFRRQMGRWPPTNDKRLWAQLLNLMNGDLEGVELNLPPTGMRHCQR